MSSIGYKSGLIVDGDVVSLAPGVIYKGSYLYDMANGAEHRLSNTASFIIKYIVKPTRWSRVQNSLRERYLATDTIRRVLNFLDDIGGLAIVRSVRGVVSDFYYKSTLLLHGIVLSKPAHRYTGDFRGGIRAVARAMLGLLVLMLLAVFIGYGLNFPLMNLAILSVWFCACLLFSTLAHECVHLLFALSDRKGSREMHLPYFLQRGLRLGLIFAYTNSEIQTRSALLGPVVGVLTALLLAIPAAIVGIWLAAVVAATVAVFHLFSWLPIYGDGEVIWNVIRKDF